MFSGPLDLFGLMNVESNLYLRKLYIVEKRIESNNKFDQKEHFESVKI